nr:MAG TPA: hypothetical protein [Caudoviricetes sp.]
MKVPLWKRCDLNYTAVWHGYDIVEKNLNTLSIKYIRFLWEILHCFLTAL